MTNMSCYDVKGAQEREFRCRVSVCEEICRMKGKKLIFLKFGQHFICVKYCWRTVYMLSTVYAAKTFDCEIGQKDVFEF
jgi:hypothetical protein